MSIPSFIFSFRSRTPFFNLLSPKKKETHSCGRIHYFFNLDAFTTPPTKYQCSSMNRYWDFEDVQRILPSKSHYQRKTSSFNVFDTRLFLIPFILSFFRNQGILYSKTRNNSTMEGTYSDTETDFSSTITFKEMVLWCKIQSSKIYDNWRSFRSSIYSIKLFSMWLSEDSYSCSYVCWFMYLWMWLL